MQRNLLIAVLVACLATAVSGLVEGRYSNRWGLQPDLVSAGEKLARVPEKIGDWDMKSSEPFDNEVVDMLQCAGHFSRVYVNAVTGESVRVALLVGPPGPTAVHTPEICYSSRGQTAVEQPKPVATRPKTDADEALWRIVFRANDLEQSRFSVVYGWAGPEGHWRADANARYAHAGEPMLYKIQVAGPLTELPGQESSDLCQDFLKDFLPAVDATLFQIAAK
jgi:Protein of unknown function (DUF3485)